MGKLHWAKHAKKPAPLVSRDIDEYRRLVVRQRFGSTIGQPFVASIVWKTAPAPGQHVVLYRYGDTAEEAERRALEAFYT